jgi:hypothetical protein
VKWEFFGVMKCGLLLYSDLDISCLRLNILFLGGKPPRPPGAGPRTCEPSYVNSGIWGFPVTAHRAKRENGGLGEDPPGSTMTY